MSGIAISIANLLGTSILRPPGSPILWVRADQMPLGASASWTDLSGNGHNLTTAGSQPVNTAGAGPLASLPAFQFVAASSQVFSIANALIGTKNFTLATVAKVSATSSAQTIAVSGQPGSGNGIGMFVDVNATGARDFNAAGVVAVSDSTNLATTNWEAWIFSSDASGNLTLTVNGSTHTLSPTSATAAAPGANFAVGGSGTGTLQLNGFIYEIAAYSTIQPTAPIAAYQLAQTGL